MKDLNNETPAVGEVLKPTPGPWDVYEDRGWWHVARSRSAAYVGLGNYNDIATMHFDIDMVQGEQKEVQEANARLFTASCNSYQKHFPADPVTAAESDELGKSLAQTAALRALVGELAEGLEKSQDTMNKMDELFLAEVQGRSRAASRLDGEVREYRATIKALIAKAAKAKEAGL